MKKKFIIRLSEEERQDLTNLVRKGKVAAYKRTHAQILLLADEGEHGPRHQDNEVNGRKEELSWCLAIRSIVKHIR